MATGKLTFPKSGQLLTIAVPRQYRVNQPCDNPNNGRWFCITHTRSFQTQFEKDGHVHRGNHQLVWVCNEHGLESDPKWGE